jgi:hypothetical protein
VRGEERADVVQGRHGRDEHRGARACTGRVGGSVARGSAMRMMKVDVEDCARARNEGFRLCGTEELEDLRKRRC